MKEGEMGQTCSTHGRYEKCILVGKMKGEDYVGDIEFLGE
jgi:hypothetical protein